MISAARDLIASRIVRWLVVSAWILMAVSAASAQTKKSPAAKPSGDAEFAVLLERYCQGWSGLNPDTVAPLYAQDADLVFYDLAPFQYKGWAEYREGVQKTFFDKLSSIKVTCGGDLRVTRRGNVAWTTMTLHILMVGKDGRPGQVDARHTAIWEMRGNHWLIVHEHVSIPLPAS